MKSDREYIDRLVTNTEDTVSLFSNPRKRERECMVARAVLRLFSVPYREEELLEVPPEPVDVCVAGASFQVTEVLDEGRQPHRQIRERLERYRDTKRLEELVEPIVPGVPTSITPRRVSGEELLQRVAAALHAKELRYGSPACADLDALVYLNLQAAVLSADLEREMPVLCDAACWRSVSVVSGHHGLVLAAEENAPEFLRARAGFGAVVWPKPSGLWEP